MIFIQSESCIYIYTYWRSYHEGRLWYLNDISNVFFECPHLMFFHIYCTSRPRLAWIPKPKWPKSWLHNFLTGKPTYLWKIHENTNVYNRITSTNQLSMAKLGIQMYSYHFVTSIPNPSVPQETSDSRRWCPSQRPWSPWDPRTRLRETKRLSASAPWHWMRFLESTKGSHESSRWQFS